ncbi:hypothetical protein [uncultured Campylobacter sp.]|uniref:hypothetical protein n=1 Tax=uncultured Campylobacter sp. TaxID=218934 RepID=UPI00261AE0E6|nr:hypothetical protein [uncultured Campylobacter sp.]
MFYRGWLGFCCCDFGFAVAVFGFVASSAIVAIYTAPRYFKFSFGFQILGAMLLKFKFSLARRI